MIRFISFVFGTLLELAQLQFWEEESAAAQLSCDKKRKDMYK